MKLKSLLLILSLCVSPLFAQNKYYVSATKGDDTNDGTMWSKAFATLQPALEKAVANDEIWIAAGTYYPTKSISEENTDKSQYNSFVLPKGIKLYGGFPAQADDNTGISQRNWEAYPTILSGDFNDDDEDFANMDENAYHVLILIEADKQTVVDGFTITGGNAGEVKTINVNGTPVFNHCGGGVYAAVISGSLETSPTLNNVIIEYNKASYDGGGIYNYAERGEANPIITNATIRNNKAERNGGGFYNDAVTGTSPVLTNVIISGNEAGKTGGGIYCDSEREITAPVLTNVLICGNKANDAGGMVCYSYDNVTPVLTNVTIVGNYANDEGGGFACRAEDGRNGISSPKIYNSVIWGNKAADFPNIYNYGYTGSNPKIYYSLIEEEPGDDAAGNLDVNTDPEFISAVSADFAPTSDGNYQLDKFSPLINSGNNKFVSVDKDLNGKTRIVDGTVDIGAYEYPETGGGPTNNEYISIENNQLWASGGNLYVNIKEPTTIRIYTVDGTLFYQENRSAEGSKVISLPAGIYFVSLNNSTKAKIHVTQ
ncbi:MAG: T9SS type A sorting domain-containing protein [Tannerella sp.]|jgi:predicted outer membrane repeat protein|nr:T9SS type A sorting domain-containing protein [Tannerella sp.]